MKYLLLFSIIFFSTVALAQTATPTPVDTATPVATNTATRTATPVHTLTATPTLNSTPDANSPASSNFNFLNLTNFWRLPTGPQAGSVNTRQHSNCDLLVYGGNAYIRCPGEAPRKLVSASPGP